MLFTICKVVFYIYNLYGVCFNACFILMIQNKLSVYKLFS